MSNLSADIHEAINKNLPSSVGTVLQERLKEAENDRIALEAARKKIDVLNSELIQAKINLGKHQTLDEREAEYDDKIEKLRIREKNLEVTLLQKDVEKEKVRGDAVMTLVQTLFSNTVIKRKKMGDVPQIHQCSDGTTYSSTVPVDLQEEERQE